MGEEHDRLCTLENLAFSFMSCFFLILLSHWCSAVRVTGSTIHSWEFKKLTSRKPIQNVKNKTQTTAVVETAT